MTITGCDKLISRLEKASNDLEKFERKGALHDYLVDTWRTGYDEAKFCYDTAVTLEGEPANQGTTVVDPPTWNDEGLELVATGEDIAFLEFGTGLNMDYENPYASKFGFYPSSYSGGPGKGFLVAPKVNHFHGAWPHEKKLHWGQNPARGMYNAFRAMDMYVRTTPLRLFKK